MLQRKAASEKILMLGLDGLDPRLTRKYVDQGIMPNTKKIIEVGAQRHDLVMLGGHPTVTPPMWTTMATGCYANVHGITSFYRQSKTDLDAVEYNMDSRNCLAEQLWNVFAEAGKKTLVWHWPGSAWPPSSDSPNLYVVDGTAPGSVNMSTAQVEGESVLGANAAIAELKFLPKMATDAVAPCVIEDLDVSNDDAMDLSEQTKPGALIKTYILNGAMGMGLTDGINMPCDAVQSPIKEASGWANAPAGAKEFTVLLGGGFIRRPALILQNDEGIYDQVALYKSKKETEPIVVLPVNKMVYNVIDEGYKNDKSYTVNRNFKVLELAPDGSKVRMYISAAMDTSADALFSPVRIHKAITENIGFPPPSSMLYGQDRELYTCMLDCWYEIAKWQANSLKYMIEQEGIDVIFSHYHAVDLVFHTFVRYVKDKGQNKQTEAEFEKWLEELYILADTYIGYFVDLLDKDWTLFVFSDHALVSPEHLPDYIGDMSGINIRVMNKLGYTYMKRDEMGNELREIDWSKTRAIASQSNNIYINLKGRDEHGIVDPADKYELEEQIMTDLYSYKHPDTGKRVIALALRNRDAVLLGYGGPECGDICYWTAEGYNYDHADGLATCYGFGDTSLSPIFIAAGKGLKKGFETDRIIRQVDLVPTAAVIGGVRMPRECEGAPVYQILAEDY